MKSPRQDTSGLPAKSASATLFSWSPRPNTRMLTLPEQVAEKIGSAIIQGHLAPGERLQEQKIADSVGVSRGPVRDALRILERNGLVQINARRGTWVTQPTVREVNDVFNMRIALVGLAARLAAEQKDSSVITELRAKIDRLTDLARGADVDAYLNALYEINWVLPDATGNNYLRNTLSSLIYLSLRYARLRLATEKRRLQSARKWRTLLNLIEQKRGKDAEVYAQSIIRESRDSALAILRKQAAGSVVPEDGPVMPNASAARIPKRVRDNMKVAKTTGKQRSTEP